MRRVVSLVAALLLSVTWFAGSGLHAAAEEPGEPLSALERQLQELVDEYPRAGEYAVAVTDLQTGETISVDGRRPHLAACSVNLLVLIQTTLDVQSGRTTQDLVDDLIARTIYSSNPVTARDLYAIAGRGSVLSGVRRVVALMDRIGMDDSVLDHPPGYGRESLGVDRNNWVTALDANRALEWIWSDESLTPARRGYLLDHLTGVKPGLNYLMATVPTTVSHKNGFFPASDGTYVDNDVAIVRFLRDGREYAYLISFFSQWVPRKYDDIALGQALARETWDFFSKRYPE